MRRALITAALVIYAGFLLHYTCFAAGGADSSGYLNAARMIAEGRPKIRVTPLDVMHLDDSWRSVFLPLGFARAPEPKTLSPSYPLGFPLQLAPFGLVGGWKHAPFYVSPILMLLSLFVTYAIAREVGLPDDLAIGAAVLVATAAAVFNQAIQPMSDVPAMLWCCLPVLCAIRQYRGARWAIAAGASFAMSVWVRPSNMLLALAIGFAMRWRVRSLAIAVASALPLGVALMLTNHSLFGSGLVTGYGGVGGMMKFAAPCAMHYLKWLTITLTPIVFPLGLLFAFQKRVALWQRLTLAAWFVPFFVFYSIYPICDAWWYLRFLVPVYPPLIIGTMLVLRDFVRWRNVRYALIGIVALTGIGVIRHYRVGGLHKGEMIYPHSVHWAQKQLPPNAIVATMQISGAYYFYAGQLPARYDMLEPDRFSELRAYAGVAGLKWYALIFDWEMPELERHMPGRWTKLNTIRNVYLLRLDS